MQTQAQATVAQPAQAMRYRVLATHWEAETYTEIWATDKDSADLVARLLRGYDREASVQVDAVRR